MRVRFWLVACACLLLPLTAAAQNGAIAGRVTNTATSLPVPGALVIVYNGAGDYVADDTTDALGVYTVTGIPPGTVYAHSSVSTILVNEVYNDVPCLGFCTAEKALTGAGITVAAGLTTTGIDFPLSPGGSISGTVTDATTLAPLVNVAVRITSVTGEHVTSPNTSGAGVFTTAVGLISGTYYAYTSNSLGYFNEIYDDVSCGTGCSGVEAASRGTPIVVTVPATAIANFALTRGSGVSGSVTVAGSGAPLTAVQVYIVKPWGALQTIAETDALGAYATTAIPAGTYFAYTANERGFINQLFSGVVCAGECSSLDGGTAITVGTGEVATGRNFALAAGGRIAGTVRAAATGAPLPDVAVYLYSSAGSTAGVGVTDASGFYLSGVGLPPGTYFAHTSNSSGYIDEIFDNVPCGDGCLGGDVATRGRPIGVTARAITSERDFSLDRGGRITGRVTNASTGAVVSGIAVRALAIDTFGSGPQTTNAVTNSRGDYTISGLPAGQYVVHTAAANLVNEIYNDLPCGIACNERIALASGQKLTVALEGLVSSIDFALSPGSTVSGTVTNASSGTPLAGIRVFILSSTASTIVTRAAAVTDASGAFNAPGLPPGSYHAYTANSSGFINETHGGFACLGQCLGPEATLSPPFTVIAGTATTGLNFALDPGARIGGVVTDSASGLPLEFIEVSIADTNGRIVTFGESDPDGSYITRDGLPAGTYYAFTSYAQGFIGEVFDNVPCPGRCATLDIAAVGAPIVVAAGATAAGRNFAIAPGGTISGTVTDAASGVLLSFVGLEIHDGAGRFVTTGSSGSGDWVSSDGLPSGTFFAFSRSPSHTNEIFDNIACPARCAASKAATGTPIAVTAGAITGGRSFALAARTGVPGPPVEVSGHTDPGGTRIDWGEPPSGGLPVSYLLEAGLAPGTTAVSFPVNDRQFVVAGAPAGVYFVRVKGINGAGVGPPSPDFVLVIGAGGPPPGPPELLRVSMIGTRLTLTWSAGFSGGDPTQYVVEAGSASGVANIATLPASTRAFTYAPVPPGFYFLRVRARNATGTSAPSNEVMIAAGGAAAPPRAPHRVGATAAGSTVSLVWNAAAGATGYVIEAGSATGLSNLAVLSVGPATAASFPGIPPGTYYVRVRAVNALGRSVASEEVIVVVG